MGGAGSKNKGAGKFSLFSKKASIVVVGIDGAGKSTVINHVKNIGEKRLGTLAPTVGCSVEEVRIGNVALTVFDMAGGSKYRNMWSGYYKDVSGVVYVIDSADAMRLAVSREELEEMLGDDSICKRKVPILFLANKMDLPHSMTHQQIAETMDLAGLATNHTWTIKHCCGLTGEGVREGWDWISEQVLQHQRDQM